MADKRFVLDTNVLLHDPFAITRFGAHEVVLPIYVVEELDQDLMLLDKGQLEVQE